MAALGAMAQRFGAQHPQQALAAVPAILAAAGDEQATVRSSALAAAAAVLSTLGKQALPQLPAVIPVVLQVTEGAVEQLPTPAQVGI